MSYFECDDVKPARDLTGGYIPIVDRNRIWRKTRMLIPTSKESSYRDDEQVFLTGNSRIPLPPGMNTEDTQRFRFSKFPRVNGYTSQLDDPLNRSIALPLAGLIRHMSTVGGDSSVPDNIAPAALDVPMKKSPIFNISSTFLRNVLIALTQAPVGVGGGGGQVSKKRASVASSTGLFTATPSGYAVSGLTGISIPVSSSNSKLHTGTLPVSPATPTDLVSIQNKRGKKRNSPRTTVSTPENWEELKTQMNIDVPSTPSSTSSSPRTSFVQTLQNDQALTLRNVQLDGTPVFSSTVVDTIPFVEANRKVINDPTLDASQKLQAMQIYYDEKATAKEKELQETIALCDAITLERDDYKTKVGETSLLLADERNVVKTQKILLREQKKEISDCLARVAKLQVENETLSKTDGKQIEVLQNKITQLQKENEAQIEQLNLEIKKLSEETRLLKIENDTSMIEAKQQFVENNKLVTLLEEQRSYSADANANLQRATLLLAQTDASKEKISNELVSLQKNNSEQLKTLKDLEREYEKVMKSNEQLVLQNNNQLTAIKGYKSQIKELKDDSSLQNELRTQKETINLLEKEVKDRTNEINKLKEDATNYVASLTSHMEEQNRTNIADKQAIIDALNARIANLNNNYNTDISNERVTIEQLNKKILSMNETYNTQVSDVLTSKEEVDLKNSQLQLELYQAKMDHAKVLQEFDQFRNKYLPALPQVTNVINSAIVASTGNAITYDRDQRTRALMRTQSSTMMKDSKFKLLSYAMLDDGNMRMARLHGTFQGSGVITVTSVPVFILYRKEAAVLLTQLTYVILHSYANGLEIPAYALLISYASLIGEAITQVLPFNTNQKIGLCNVTETLPILEYPAKMNISVISKVSTTMFNMVKEKLNMVESNALKGILTDLYLRVQALEAFGVTQAQSLPNDLLKGKCSTNDSLKYLQKQFSQQLEYNLNVTYDYQQQKILMVCDNSMNVTTQGIINMTKLPKDTLNLISETPQTFTPLIAPIAMQSRLQSTDNATPLVAPTALQPYQTIATPRDITYMYPQNISTDASQQKLNEVIPTSGVIETMKFNLETRVGAFNVSSKSAFNWVNTNTVSTLNLGQLETIHQSGLQIESELYKIPQVQSIRQGEVEDAKMDNTSPTVSPRFGKALEDEKYVCIDPDSTDKYIKSNMLEIWRRLDETLNRSDFLFVEMIEESTQNWNISNTADWSKSFDASSIRFYDLEQQEIASNQQYMNQQLQTGTPNALVQVNNSDVLQLDNIAQLGDPQKIFF